MATSIPSYQKACLAADDFNAALYLVGVSNSQPGLLEINHIPLANGLNNLTFTQFDSQPDTQKWASGAEKACYAYKGPTDANAVVKVIQFGSATSYMSYFSSTGVVADPTFFGTLKFQSSKLFSWVGSFTVTGFNVFHMYAISPSIANSRWVGLRMGFVASRGGYTQ
ncbi:hypothetical protein BGZ95_008379 [Linnemannia exigua]|uniref:Uncharacterized protein n=1 Tax=Linnemannia exigua TaxID=604196 RepID=A0AAD4DEC6_9FUNG|nr:hypothetical protein BGZ95_008379 [Linnemannia exigua]